MFAEPEEKPEKPPSWAGSRLADEAELLAFLKAIRPDWSQPAQARGAQSNMKRVLKKLGSIGVKTKEDLIERTLKNKINEDLNNAGYTRFGRETVDNIKKQAGFFKLMENLTDAGVRQHGRFAPVPHLLSKKTRYGKSAGAAQHRELSPVDDAMMQASMDHEDFLMDSPRSHYDTSNFGSNFGQLEDDWGGHGPGDSRYSDGFGDSRRLRHGWHTYTPDSHRTSWRDSKMSLSNSLPSLSRSQTDWTPRAARERSISAVSKTRPSRKAEELSQHVQALQSASSRGNKAFSRMALQGEDELESMDQDQSFQDQGGSSTQMVKITASYAKLGVNSKRVLALLMDENLTVRELRRHLDQLAAGRLQQVGSEMLGRSKGLARWKTEAGDHSRTMLLEAAALDEKARLQKMMRMEGTVSPLDAKNTPLRRHIARNLCARMKEEHLRASSTSMEVSQKVNGIKKELTMMANSKKELGSLQRKMLSLNPEQRVQPAENQWSGMGIGGGSAAAASSDAKPAGSPDNRPMSRQVSFENAA